MSFAFGRFIILDGVSPVLLTEMFCYFFAGFVIGYPGVTPDNAYITTVSNVFGAKKPTVSLHTLFPGQEEPAKAKALKNKKFIVKVQIPTTRKSINGVETICDLKKIDLLLFIAKLSGCLILSSPAGGGSMMVYNEDRSVHFFINSDTQGDNYIKIS